jgi:hypothetical protein
MIDAAYHPCRHQVQPVRLQQEPLRFRFTIAAAPQGVKTDIGTPDQQYPMYVAHDRDSRVNMERQEHDLLLSFAGSIRYTDCYHDVFC